MSSPRDEDRTVPDGEPPPGPPQGEAPPPRPEPSLPDGEGSLPRPAETVQFLPDPAPALPADDSGVTVCGPAPAPLRRASAQPDSGEPATGAPTSLSLEVPPDLARHPRYKITRFIGGGGMGMVFQAEHRLMDRCVALKVIQPRFLSHPAAVERFHREVQAAARLHHPNIVAAYDADQAGSTHFLVMEFVHGQNLTEYLRSKGKLNVAEACDIACQVARGLEHAFQHKMVHRDIKPDNLMRSTQGEIKILDFGLARFAQEEGLGHTPGSQAIKAEAAPVAAEALTVSDIGHRKGERDSQLTIAGSVMGTPDYMAPEQIKDTHAADIRSDIYALGCTLYQLLTGMVPFPKGKTGDKLERHLKEKPRPIRQLRPEVPAGLAQVLDKMLAKDPAQRFQTPGEVSQALEPFAKAQGSRTRRRLLRAGLALLLLAGAAAAFFLTWGPISSGTLKVSADVPEVSIAVFRADDADPAFRRFVVQGGQGEFLLPPGNYRLTLPDAPEELTLFPVTVNIEADRTSQVFIKQNVPRPKPEPEKKKEDHWPTFPLPGPAELAVRPSPFDDLPGMSLPEHLGELGLKKPMALVAVLGGTDYRLAGPGSFPAFSADSELVAVGSGTDILLMETASGGVRRTFRGHKQALESLALSPDGKWLASSARDSTVRLWDRATGMEKKSWFRNHSAVAFSPDSKTLAFGQSPNLQLYDLASDTLEEFLMGTTATSLAFHPKESWLVVGQARGNIALFSLGDRKFHPFLDTIKRLASDRIQVAFSAAGDRLAVGSDLMVQVYRTAKEPGKELSLQWSQTIPADGLLGFGGDKLYVARHQHPNPDQLAVHQLDAVTGKHFPGLTFLAGEAVGPINCLALSPDGRWVAACVLHEGRVLHLYDLKERRIHNKVPGHQGSVTALAFSCDGARLVTTGADRFMHTWDPARRADLGAFPLWAFPETLTFSPDGRHVAIAAEQSVRFWTAKEGFRKTYRLAAVPLSLAYNVDGKTLFAGGRDGRILSLDVDALLDREAYATTTSDVKGLVLDRTGKFLAAAGQKGQIHIWEVGTQRQMHLLPGHSTDAFPEPTGVRVLACSADNRWLFSTGRDGTVRVWDWESGGRLHLLHGLTGEGVALAPSPDGRFLAVGGSDGQILLWDLEASPPRRLTVRHASRAQREGLGASVAFTPEGRYLAAGLPDGTVEVYRLAPRGKPVQLEGSHSGLRLERLVNAPQAILDWRLTPDGNRVVSIHKGGHLSQWNLKTGEEVVPEREGKFNLLRLALSPDGKTAWAITTQFKPAGVKLRRWKLDEKGPGEEVGALKGPEVLALNGLGQVLLRERDGDCLLRQPDGKEAAIFHSPQKMGAALSPNGRWAMIGLPDRTAHLIDLAARKVAQTFPCEGVASAFSFSPDSTCLAWSSQRETVSVFDLEEQVMRHSLTVPDGLIREIAISHDNRFLVLGNLQGLLALYDLATGQNADVVRTTPLLRAAFTPDGQYLLTTHLLGQPRLWKVPR